MLLGYEAAVFRRVESCTPGERKVDVGINTFCLEFFSFDDFLSRNVATNVGVLVITGLVL